MGPLIYIGVPLVAVASIWGVSKLMKKTSVGAPGAAGKSDTQKNVDKGAPYAAGKAMGYTVGGIDYAKGIKAASPETNADAIAASNLTADPAQFLSGYVDGYNGGWSGAEAASKISTDAKSSDEAPPPPPAPPATPAGKPASYVKSPNDEGYSTGYGEGKTFGRNNKIDYAPGSGNANGLKSSDSTSAAKKYDSAQLDLWSQSWDKGFSDGWDAGQSEFHASSGGSGGGTVPYGTDTTSTDTSGGDTRGAGVSVGAASKVHLIGFDDRKFAAILRDVSSGALDTTRAAAIAHAIDRGGFPQHADGIRAVLAKRVSKVGAAGGGAHAPHNKPAGKPPVHPWIARRVFPPSRRAA